jgi:hypothetical protein
MSLRTSVTIIASPRPRVGKTLLARLLVDFHRHEGHAVAGYDLNTGEGTLREFLPEHTTAAVVGNVKGQMALFDRLIADDGVAKVIDVGHESFAPFFAIADQIGFLAETNKQAIAVAILFLLTPDASSVEAYASLSKRFPGMLLSPVHNEILGPAQYRGKYPIGHGALLLRIRLLAPGLRKYIERPPFSFADDNAASDAGLPADVHAELQHWLRRVHVEFRELGLRMLLADLQSSIRIES